MVNFYPRCLRVDFIDVQWSSPIRLWRQCVIEFSTRKCYKKLKFGFFSYIIFKIMQCTLKIKEQDFMWTFKCKGKCRSCQKSNIVRKRHFFCIYKIYQLSITCKCCKTKMTNLWFFLYDISKGLCQC